MNHPWQAAQMEAVLDGRRIDTVKDVHDALARALDFGPYYGSNLAALWDRLSTDVPRPVLIRWIEATESHLRLGVAFDEIVAVFQRVVDQDTDLGLVDTFRFNLE